MGSQLDVLCKVVHRDYDDQRWVLWPAVSGPRLGDYGTMDGKVFVWRGNILDEQGWWTRLPSITGGEHSSRIDFTSDAAVNVEFSASAQGGNVKISFTKEDAVVLEAQGVDWHRFEDYAHIEMVVKQQDEAGRWDRDWVVAMETLTCRRVFAAASTAKNTSIRLSYAGDGGAREANDLAALDLTVTAKDNDTAAWLQPRGSDRDMAVLGRLYKLRQPVGGRRSFEPL